VDIFDLPVGDPSVRPDQAMAYAACRMAEQDGGNYRDGCFGAGCGATIGKYAGESHAMKSGIGSCVLRRGNLMVGAVVAVNAMGDIFDWKNGQKIAGAYAGDGRLLNRTETISHLLRIEGAKAALNTTIGIVFTNAPFCKAQLCKIAAMAHDGFARSIFPVHTSGDGDSIIALSVPAVSSGEETGESYMAGIDTVGTLAAWAASEAVLCGVRSAESAYGFRALADLKKG
jgi:L-aminopeptidase/D-esterase-like protein